VKVYIMVDFEGIAGMVEWDNYWADTPCALDKRLRMRHILTGEVNAAVEGVVNAGATEIVVWDSHGPSNNCNNFILEELRPEPWVIIGNKGLPSFYPTLDDSFDAGLYVGGHAMAGTVHATLPHTVTLLNEKQYGEVGMFAAMCGFYGVPMVFVSGDQATVEEVQQAVPDVEHVVTKIAFGPYAAKTRTPAKAREMICEGTERALGRISEIAPLAIGPPYTMGEGDAAKTSDSLAELIHERSTRSSKTIGNTDLDPERTRHSEGRAEWQKTRSFLAP